MSWLRRVLGSVETPVVDQGQTTSTAPSLRATEAKHKRGLIRADRVLKAFEEMDASMVVTIRRAKARGHRT